MQPTEVLGAHRSRLPDYAAILQLILNGVGRIGVRRRYTPKHPCFGDGEKGTNTNLNKTSTKKRPRHANVSPPHMTTKTRSNTAEICDLPAPFGIALVTRKPKQQVAFADPLRDGDICGSSDHRCC